MTQNNQNATDPRRADASWTCPRCGGDVPHGWRKCWSCGTSVDGTEDSNFVTADQYVPQDTDAPVPPFRFTLKTFAAVIVFWILCMAIDHQVGFQVGAKLGVVGLTMVASVFLIGILLGRYMR